MKTFIAILSLLCSSIAFAGTATLSWTNPTTNTDGSSLTLASINIYRATSATGPWTNIASAPMSSTGIVPSSYVDNTAIDGLTEYYAITAVGKDGIESVQSAVVSKAIPGGTPSCPTTVAIK